MADLTAANAALAAKRETREAEADRVRAEHRRRWAAVADALDAIELPEPRSRATLVDPAGVMRTFGDVLRASGPAIKGFHALTIDDAETIASALAAR